MSNFDGKDILSISNGPIEAGSGALAVVSGEVSLRVLVYTAAGELFRQEVFPSGNDDDGIAYFNQYEGLSFSQSEKNVSGVQLNLEKILGKTGFDLEGGIYHLVANLVHQLSVGTIIDVISDSRTELQFKGKVGTLGQNHLPDHIAYHALDFGEGRFSRLLNWTLEDGNTIAKLTDAIPIDVSPGFIVPVTVDVTTPTKMTIDWETQAYEPEFRYLTPNFDINVQAGTLTNTEFKTFDQLTGTVATTKHDILNKYISQSNDGPDVSIDHRDPKNFIHFSSYEERLLNFKYKLQLIEKYQIEEGTLNSIGGATATATVITNDKNSIVTKRRNVIANFDSFENYMYKVSSSYESSSYGDLWPNTWPKNTTVAPHRIYATTSSEAQAWLTGARESASYFDRMNDNILSKALPEYILLDPNNSTIGTVVDMIGQHYDVIWTYIKGITDINSRDEDLSSGIAKDLLWHVGTSLGIDLPNGNSTEDLWKYALGTDVSGSVASSGTGYSSGSLPQLTSEDVTKSIWSRLINNLPYFIKTRGTTRGIKAVLATYGVPSTIMQIKEYGGPKGVNDGERQQIVEDKMNYAVNIHEHAKIRVKTAKHNSTGLTPRAFQFRFKTDQYKDQVLLEKTAGDHSWFVNMYHSSSITQTSYPQVGSANISAQLMANPKQVEKEGIFGRLSFIMSASHTGSNIIPIVSASTEYLPLYNGDWWNVTLQSDVTASVNASTDNTTTNQRWHIIVKAAKDHSDGRITHSGSATLTNHSGSYSASFNNAWREIDVNEYWDFGSSTTANSEATRYPSTGIAGAVRTTKAFSGSFQEVRIWGGDELEDDVMDVHTLAPTSYVGNNFSSSYDDLWARFPLGTEFKKSNLSGSIGTYVSPTIISSSHPNQNVDWTGGVYALHATASGFGLTNPGTNGTHFLPNEETFYITTPSTPSNTQSSRKIRVEDSWLTKQLSVGSRAELSEYDRHPKDTNTVGVHLSLQHQINRDIALQFGGMRIDDYIGDPEHLTLRDYPDLLALQNFYFKKVTAKPDMADFSRILNFYDVSMFHTIKKMVPARANSYVGLLVEPTILERSKVQRMPDMTQSAHHFRTVIEVKDKALPSMSSDYVSDLSASLKVAGGENWYRFGAETVNSSSFGDLSDTITIGHESASYAGTRYIWTQDFRNKNADGTFTTGSYIHDSNPFNTVITGSRTSEIVKVRQYRYSSSFSASWDSDRGIMAGTIGYGLSGPLADVYNTNFGLVENGKWDRQRGKAHIFSSSYWVPLVPAETQLHDYGTGFFNARYGGCKLIGGNYNEDTPFTHDGSPVIEIFDSNPNQLIVTSPSVYGGSLQVPGIIKYPTSPKGGGKYTTDKFNNPVMLAPNSPAVATQANTSNITKNPGAGASVGQNNTYS